MSNAPPPSADKRPDSRGLDRWPPTSSPCSELTELYRLIELGGPHLRPELRCQVTAAGQQLDVLAITLGSTDPRAPTLGLFGGVHGLERIGTEVVMAFFSSLVHRLKWDASLHDQLATMRLVIMPVVNPGGLWLGTRANPQGVDLMRNSPVESEEDVPFLLSGQRLSAALPWYRGPAGQPMQDEAQALCDVVTEHMLCSDFALALDCHSGFGVQDRIWFPYAHTPEPVPHLAELHALHRVYDQSHPHHHYIFEPQSVQYLTHGDLWDHLYQLSLSRPVAPPDAVFLPLTLEMGSWLWIKKNPRQLFNRHGIFNPLIGHRHQRVLRRHTPWLEFLMRATASHSRWRPEPSDRSLHHRQALARWYPDVPHHKGLVRP